MKATTPENIMQRRSSAIRQVSYVRELMEQHIDTDLDIVLDDIKDGSPEDAVAFLDHALERMKTARKNLLGARRLMQAEKVYIGEDDES